MTAAPTGPGGLPGWTDLAPLEAVVWGYLLLPGKRCLRAFAAARAGEGATEKARTSTYSSLKNAKARGREKLAAAAKAHGTDLDTMLDALKRGQRIMDNAPTQRP